MGEKTKRQNFGPGPPTLTKLSGSAHGGDDVIIPQCSLEFWNQNAIMCHVFNAKMKISQEKNQKS